MRHYSLHFRTALLAAAVLASGNLVWGNPVGGKVGQGSASFSTSGSQFTVTTSDRAFISWQSFNIGVGETTTFVQPSSSSVVWNQINDPNPSQILGNLNANGYVILQNSSGFYIGGQAAITAHGVMLTTAPTPAPDLSGGGPWEFSAPAPTASIINYGQINITGAGSAFLIAHDIENQGTINAPGGNIGLYAGKDVLVSTRPDGRGLSATVTLPEGSVDNSGKLIADGGSIALHAQVVNQGGLIQANSVKNVQGTIELVASDAVNLGAGSVISAKGDSQGISSGGSVTVKSDNSFSDQTGSTINIAGGAKGGDGGQLEISAGNLTGIQSLIDGHAASGFQGGTFTIDPTELDLTAAFVRSLTPTLNSGLYQLTLQADDTITVDTLWNLANPGGAALLTLTAGNNIVFKTGTGIKAGQNWSVNLSAGPTGLLAKPAAGTDGIYLNGTSFIDTLNGNINLSAANDIIVNNGAVRTRGGGSINVTAEYGNVNTGVNINGFLFGQAAAPYYIVNANNLGGISTAAGGNVSITAGGDVTSFTPVQTSDPTDYANAKNDAGTGAFGAQPGNVTINAGGNVYGHYVLADGVGSITAGGNIGQPIIDSTGHNTSGRLGFALSVINGNWNVSAPNGNIYVQDVRNPSGVFNEKNTRNASFAGYHLFNYDSLSSVSLDAGDSVEFTGLLAPHLPISSGGTTAVPFILPPSLEVTAGAGGFVMDQSLDLFPSANGNLNITTTDGGNFVGVGGFNDRTSLTMLSGNSLLFDNGIGHPVYAGLGSNPLEINNPNPVIITVSGSIKSVDINTVKATQITVTGDLDDVGFIGQNLHASDTTYLDVTGKIINTPGLHFVDLAGPIVSANPLQPNDWTSVFQLAVNPALIGADTRTLGSTTLQQYIQKALLFQSIPGFVYDSATDRLGYNGDISVFGAAAINVLKGPVTVIVMGANGLPIIDPNTGKIETTTYTFLSKPANDPAYDPIGALETASLGAPPDARGGSGYTVGGPGKFNITAGSVDLGNTDGIISSGGAAINLSSTGDITMLTSRIASFDGGDVSVNSLQGYINLGSQNVFIANSGFAYGVYTSGPSDVSVTAHGDVDINGSRIAAYDGGNVSVESFFGNVNVGSGGNNYVTVPLAGRQAAQIYGSGIVAVSLPGSERAAGDPTLPGNITVTTPRGDIVASQAGILQLALDGNVAGGPTVTLTAGTPAVKDAQGNIITPAIPGNIDLGDSGLIGGTVNVTAQGDIKGLIVSRQNSNISAAQNFTGTLLSAGGADVAAGGSVVGTIISVGVANVSGTVSAEVLGQNVSVNGGSSASTLGTTAAATAAGQSAAATATDEAAKQTASDDSQDDEKKKKGKAGPMLARRTGRVTVILPRAI